MNTYDAFPAEDLLQSEINLAVPSQHNSKSSVDFYVDDDGFEHQVIYRSSPKQIVRSIDQKLMSFPPEIT